MTSPAQGSTHGFDADSVLPSAKRARQGSISSESAPAATSSPDIGSNTLPRPIPLLGPDALRIDGSEIGELRCWGSFRSSEGMLGFESRRDASKMQYSPIPIPALSKCSISDVAAGENHSLAPITDDILFA
ncbi:hypothetical protein OC861_007061 [Tilletia horrida]|nr:hypothetical protein OC861_007061 [Tilletia horrida]